MKILGLSGKKQSGKSATCNFIFGSVLVDIGVLINRDISEDGKLIGTMLVDDGNTHTCEVDPMSQSPANLELYSQYVWPFIKIYSFAYYLKKIATEVMGLSYESVYGTNDQKNKETYLRWENMPGVVIPFDASTVLCDMCGHGENPECLEASLPIKVHESGPMTAREVLQYLGTEIFRKMHNNVWVDATIRRIQIEKPEIALVCDVRFPNEVEGIQKAGGKVIRLTRNVLGADVHASELALDDYDGFDAIIDNQNMTIPEQNQAVCELLEQWGWSPAE
jgi:hypothetical protein